jgi:glycosyltransferase involved in cell wall biosynthesis
VRHLVFHQFDPREHVLGGIPGLIRELVQYAPAEHRFAIVGVQRSRSGLGAWTDVEVGGRHVRFLPVAALDASTQQRRVPHTALFVGGILRFRPRAQGAVVHSHRAEVGALLSVMYPSATRVQFLHGDAYEALRHRTETFWRFAPRGYHLAEQIAVRRSARTIVMSSSALERIRRYADRSYLGQNWFDSTRFYPEPNGDSNGVLRIGWAGRLEPPKDPLLAIDAFGALRDAGVDFNAWIAGDGTLSRAVQDAIAGKRLQDRVTMLGALEPDSLAENLRSSDVFLMSSLWEGIPRGALEALGCGVPVVSTAVGEIGTLVRPQVSGFIAGTRSPSELAELLVQAARVPRGDPIRDTVRDLEVRQVVPALLEELTTGA